MEKRAENFLMDLAFKIQRRKEISCRYGYALELAENMPGTACLSKRETPVKRESEEISTGEEIIIKKAEAKKQKPEGFSEPVLNLACRREPVQR